MSAPLPTDERPLPRALGDMEPGLSDLVAWGLAVRALGNADFDVSPEALNVIGRAITETARTVQTDLRRCLDLTRTPGDMR